MERKFKSPNLMKARDDLFRFLKENKLDPDKDYSNDPKYGKEYRRLLLRLQIERDKIMVNYPNSDIKNRKKYYKMKKDKKEKKAKAAQEEQKAKVKVVKKEKTEKKEKVSRGVKYDYPLVNGKEMTAAEKKKYRAEQRKLAAEKANPEKPSKEKKEKAPKKDKKKSTKKDKKKVED